MADKELEARVAEAERRITSLCEDREVMFKRLKAVEDALAKGGIAPEVKRTPGPPQDPNPVQCVRCNEFHANRHDTCRERDDGLWECKGGCRE